MTRRRGSFRRFMRGLAAAHEAQLPLRINIVVSTATPVRSPPLRPSPAGSASSRSSTPTSAPAIHGGGEVLPSRAREVLVRGRRLCPLTVRGKPFEHDYV